MEDVLTPDERKHIEWMRKWLKDMGIAHGSGTIELAIVDRLVARVELLEKVAAAAETYVNWAPTPKTERALVEALLAINPMDTK